jgi:tetratricopeptide (TPR) repeat protein
MPSFAEVLQVATRLLQDGRLAEAEQICRQILQAEPRHVPAIHLLGVVALKAGNAQAAIDVLTLAIRIEGNQPSLHINLGEALRAAGKLDLAAASYRQAAMLDPHAQPHFLLSLVHQVRGDLAAAESAARRAIELKPDYAEAHYALAHHLREQGNRFAAMAELEAALHYNPQYYDALINLGSLARESSQIDRARDCFHRAVALRPQVADGYFFLGNLEAAQEHWPQALAAYQRATELASTHVLALSRLGTALQALGRIDDAIAHYRRAIELKPNLAEAHYNLGTALAESGQQPDAARHYALAIQHNPAHVSAHINLGAYLQEQGDDPGALAHYDQVLRIDPSAAETHYNRALILLANGDLAAAWPEYQWRLRLPAFPVHARPEPLWQGEPWGDKTLLVHAEQGLGDTLHFVRYLPLIFDRAAKILLQVPKSLVPLLTHAGISNIYADDDPLPACDAQIPLLSLPGLVGTTLDTIPANIPYLAADTTKVRKWCERLADLEGFCIGIAWQGSPTHRSDRDRSIPLAHFEPLARVPDVKLVSLQKRDGLDQLANVPFEVRQLPDDWDETDGAFVDTAAILSTLDLVICADTAVAHLAGAMGKPVWLALSTRPDWRWLRKGTATPWYPTMRLFRQSEPGDWAPVLEQMAQEVARLIVRD